MYEVALLRKSARNQDLQRSDIGRLILNDIGVGRCLLDVGNDFPRRICILGVSFLTQSTMFLALSGFSSGPACLSQPAYIGEGGSL